MSPAAEGAPGVGEAEVAAAMRAFEQFSTVLRYREAEKWHANDIMGMRRALEAAAKARAAAPGPDRGKAERRQAATLGLVEGHALVIRQLEHRLAAAEARASDLARERDEADRNYRMALSNMRRGGLCRSIYPETALGDCLAAAHGDLDAMRGRAELAEAALQRVEWGSSGTDPVWGSAEPACPSCGAIKHDGHAPGCALAEAISGPVREGSITRSSTRGEIASTGNSLLSTAAGPAPQSDPGLTEPAVCRAGSDSTDPAAAVSIDNGHMDIESTGPTGDQQQLDTSTCKDGLQVADPAAAGRGPEPSDLAAQSSELGAEPSELVAQPSDLAVRRAAALSELALFDADEIMDIGRGPT